MTKSFQAKLQISTRKFQR